MDWPLEEDDDGQLSQVVEKMQSDGPQTVMIDGKRAAVVISIEDYERLIAEKARSR